MNKIVKILLVILAVLIIAGAGFWGGTQFAYRQVAVNAASQTAANHPQLDGIRRGPGMMGPNAGKGGWFGNNNSERGKNRQNNFGPGMMGRNNFGPGMMNRSSGGFQGVFHGGMFGGLMLLGLIFPVGILILIILGIIALFRVVKRPSAVAATPEDQGMTAVCPKCGSPVQTSWSHCASCGKSLK
jgi:hypothetical protein